MKREMVRLDNVWGVGGGLRPVKHLVKEVSSGQTGRMLHILKTIKSLARSNIQNDFINTAKHLRSECFFLY